jgi:hypothetical protein
MDDPLLLRACGHATAFLASAESIVRAPNGDVNDEIA